MVLVYRKRKKRYLGHETCTHLKPLSSWFPSCRFCGHVSFSRYMCGGDASRAPAVVSGVYYNYSINIVSTILKK
jgi:hypothetical protein